MKAIIDIQSWLTGYTDLLRDAFGERLWFVGLQGSYGRGEATPDSDIDVVVVLDALSPEDIEAYRAMLDALEHRERVCGFLSGREELLRWDPADLFQFCHDTTPILGSLDAILERVDAGAMDRAIATGACGVYHGCVHNMLFENDAEALRGLYKSATFVIRALVYREQGRFCRELRTLIDRASPADREIAAAYLRMTQGHAGDFRASSERLFAWAQGLLWTLPTE